MKRLLWLALLALVAACASRADVIDHGFGFDTRRDGQNAEVLDYRYGDSTLPVRAPAWAVAAGQSFAFERVSGPMRRGETLYVKWRDLASGRVHEQTVDLRPRLPADLRDQTLYFLIRGAQLYVYLIGPETSKRAAEAADTGPRRYRHRQIVTIYPDRPSP